MYQVCCGFEITHDMGVMRRPNWQVFFIFFPRASERRVLLIVGVCQTFSHLQIFTLELNLSSKKFSSASCGNVGLKLCLAKFSGTSPSGASNTGFSLGIKPMNLTLIEI